MDQIARRNAGFTLNSFFEILQIHSSSVISHMNSESEYCEITWSSLNESSYTIILFVELIKWKLSNCQFNEHFRLLDILYKTILRNVDFWKKLKIKTSPIHL